MAEPLSREELEALYFDPDFDVVVDTALYYLARVEELERELEAERRAHDITANNWQKGNEKLREALTGWEAREADYGEYPLSTIERGQGENIERLVGPIPYDRAEEIEEWLRKVLDA